MPGDCRARFGSPIRRKRCGCGTETPSVREMLVGISWSESDDTRRVKASTFGRASSLAAWSVSRIRREHSKRKRSQRRSMAESCGARKRARVSRVAASLSRWSDQNPIAISSRTNSSRGASSAARRNAFNAALGRPTFRPSRPRRLQYSACVGSSSVALRMDFQPRCGSAVGSASMARANRYRLAASVGSRMITARRCRRARRNCWASMSSSARTRWAAARIASATSSRAKRRSSSMRASAPRPRSCIMRPRARR